MARRARQAAGYALGGLIVLVLLPGGLFVVSRALDPLLNVGLFGSGLLRAAIAVALALPGLLLGVASIVVQATIGEGGPLQIADIEISPKTQHLVVTGPYRYTRNPMLFGTCLAYLAWAVLLNSPSAIALVLLFAAGMLGLVVPREERRLRKDFGEEYEAYRRRTPKFLPWFPRREANQPPPLE